MEQTTKQIPIHLKDISSLAFGFRVAIWLTILGLGAFLAAGQSPAWITLGIVILGFGFAHGVELCHQALHNTGFKSSKANEVFGLAMGLPLLVSFYEYRISHLLHHKCVGTDQDTEFFDYGDGPISVWSFLSTLSMWRHYVRFAGNFGRFVCGKPISGFQDKKQPILKRFYLTTVLFVLALVLLGVATSTGVRPLLTWLAAMVLVAGPVHALVEFPEHFQCDGNTKDFLSNTRSIQSNWFMTWYTNGNNFHVEHHMHPNVPMHNARKVHDILHPDHKHYDNSYRSFYRSVFARDQLHGQPATSESKA